MKRTHGFQILFVVLFTAAVTCGPLASASVASPDVEAVSNETWTEAPFRDRAAVSGPVAVLAEMSLAALILGWVVLGVYTRRQDQQRVALMRVTQGTRADLNERVAERSFHNETTEPSDPVLTNSN